MSRLPIRLRLTAVFVAVMATVLAVIGSFLYFSTRSRLDSSINEALRARQGNLRAFAGSVSGSQADAIAPGERFAQLLTVDAELIAGRPERDRPLLTIAEARRAARGLVVIERHERARFLAGPARVRGRRVVALAATSLADRERALEGLGAALLVGGPLALLLAAAIGYATAAAALVPVEKIRLRAERIGRADPGARVPVPQTNDEIRRLGRTLNEMLERMAAAAAHERSFVANASHELRTPLTALIAELDLALRHAGSAEQLRRAIAAAKTDAQQLATLASGLLDLASADEHLDVPRERIDVDELLGDVLRDLDHSARAEDRRLVTRPSGLVVRGDAAALARAMRNLAENALSHGRGEVILGADLTPDSRGVELWVQDEGDLDPALSDGEAFERFVRGSGARGRHGVGLGLALVKAVADRHGGTATLAPYPQGGVRAAIRLPVDAG